jgi:ATP-dependent exoDNAse (exonuclease V) beta subunit
VLLPAAGLDTRSPIFRRLMDARLRGQVAEEMRVFYVAVTRAQTAVALFGSDRQRINLPDSEYYSWQDEVLRARGPIEQVGGIFRLS